MIVIDLQIILQQYHSIDRYSTMKGQSFIHSSFQQDILRVVQLVNNIRENKLRQNAKERVFVGICGIPGSGKSTFSRQLSAHLQKSIVLPMDGFHIQAKYLTEEGIKRRGAAFTFDLLKFEQKILKLKNSQIGERQKYPSFDHHLKDPIEDAILISEGVQILIIEGIYTFDKHLKINSQGLNLWDLKVWVEVQLDYAINRVAKRHLKSQIQPNWELSYNRADTNDRANALYVLQNCKDRSLEKNENIKKESISIVVDNSIDF